jgi:hypothetical protein
MRTAEKAACFGKFVRGCVGGVRVVDHGDSVVTFVGAIHAASWLSVLEVIILAANRMRCPLTTFAMRYTKDQSDNFDIFLPAWLARHNKLIFGSLFAVSERFLLWRWSS